MRLQRTPVAAAADAAETAALFAHGSELLAGTPRNLLQAIKCLQHIRTTPVADLGGKWVQRAVSVRECLDHYLRLHDAGKLPYATRQRLLNVSQLLGFTIIELLKQAPEVASTHQQLAGTAHKVEAGSSTSSSNSSTAASVKTPETSSRHAV
jgi:hypothetical protein